MPAIVVDGAMSGHLEVLGVMLAGGAGIIERVREADTFDEAWATPLMLAGASRPIRSSTAGGISMTCACA
jgi:hypothetical protein